MLTGRFLAVWKRENNVAICLGLTPQQIHTLDLSTATWGFVVGSPHPPEQLQLPLQDFRRRRYRPSRRRLAYQNC